MSSSLATYNAALAKAKDDCSKAGKLWVESGTGPNQQACFSKDEMAAYTKRKQEEEALRILGYLPQGDPTDTTSGLLGFLSPAREATGIPEPILAVLFAVGVAGTVASLRWATRAD